MHTLITDLAAHLVPGPRADAVVASLREIAALPGAEVPWHALDDAFERLTAAWPGDGPRETARRETCGELHHAIASTPAYGTAPEMGATQCLALALPWFDAQVAAWTGSADPRHAAMAATAAREAREIRMYIGTVALNQPMDAGRWA